MRCANCGGGRLFGGYLRMNPACRQCGLQYQRESGYFLGSIYFNYAVTAVIVTGTYFALYFGFDISGDVLIWPLGAFCLLFPVWFYRYARSLWLGFDVYFDPHKCDGQEDDPRQV